VRKCLHGTAPHYLDDLCVLVTSEEGRQHLHSEASGVLMVPRVRMSIGQRSFAIQGPTTWNSLPASLRSSDVTLRAVSREDAPLPVLAMLNTVDRRCWDCLQRVRRHL